MNEIDLLEELDDKTKLLFQKMQKELKSKNAEINELKKQLDFLKNQVLNKIESYLEDQANKLMKISCHFLMKQKRIVIQRLQNQNLKK